MNFWRLIFLLLAMFLFSCKDKQHVTHNKRKYRQGYYKPNRAKVKHHKSKQKEEYAYKPERKQNTSPKTENKIPQKEIENEQNYSSNKNEVGTPEDNIIVEDRASDDNIEKSNLPKNKEKEEKKEKENNKVESSKIAFWLTFVATLLQILTSVLLLVLIDFFAFSLGALICGLVVVGLAIWLIIQGRRDSSRKRSLLGYVFLVIGFTFALLGAVFLIYSTVSW